MNLVLSYGDLAAPGGYRTRVLGELDALDSQLDLDPFESVHYRVHLTTSATGLLGRQRRAHFHHHFTNNKRCFGVTSPLWDYVFRTELPRSRS